MGITQLSLNRINKYIDKIPNDNILIVGCQNLYNSENYGEIAHDYYLSQGYGVLSIDICGCNGSQAMDLRDELKFETQYGLILQHGTVEHIECSIYQAFKNFHDACAINGVMIHENPKRNNWPEHGNHYFTSEFYVELSDALGYCMDTEEEPAMGNVDSGWNVCAVLRKLNDTTFITEKEFNKIYKKHIYAK